MTLQALWSNNAGTTLAAPITNVATAATLTSGSGALFPNPGANQFFTLTLISATNPAIFEITWCTARSGDAVTLMRGQEGTTALAWNAGDSARLLITAGALNILPQTGEANTWTAAQTFTAAASGLTPSPGIFSASFATMAALGGAFPTAPGGVSASTTFTTAANGQFVNVGGSGTTQTLPAASALQGMTIGFVAGAACTLSAASGAIFTELGSASSLAMPIGSSIALQSDGANWRAFSTSPSITAAHGSHAYTSAGAFSFTVPAGVYWLRNVRVWGGGGGGGGSAGFHSGGSGGSGGGYAESGPIAVTPGQVITGQVAAGGTAGSGAGPNNGGTGGVTSFGPYVGSTGGGGGIAGNGAVATTAGAQGVGTGGVFDVAGAVGSLPTEPVSGTISVGQGGAAFGTPANLQSNTTILSNGSPGNFPGGGASAGALSGSGGTGAIGACIVEY